MRIQIDGVNNSNKGAQLMMIATLNAIEHYCPDAIIRFSSPLDPSVFAPFTKLRIEKVQPAWYKRYVVDSHIGLWLAKASKSLFAKACNWKKVSGVDLLIDIGGFQFGDQWNHTINEIECRKDYQRRLKGAGAKIVFMPQAFGPFEKKESKLMLEVLDEYSDLLIARDDISKRYLLENNVKPSQIDLYPDFTHSVSPVKPDVEDHYSGAVCLIPNSMMIRQNIVDEETYISFFQSIVEFVKSIGFTPFLLNHEGPSDLALCNKINDSLSNPIHVYSGLNAVQTKWVISKSYMVISSRFHGVANALSSSVPCLATSWNHKYQKLFESYGMSDSILDAKNFEAAKEKIAFYLNTNNNITTREKLKSGGSIIASKNIEMWEKVLM